MSFTVFTDSAANLNRTMAYEYNIKVIPLPYFINGEEYNCMYPDDFDDTGYYQVLKDGTKVTTSQINPQRYTEYMEPVLESGDNILYIGISSGISGAFSSAQMAREELIKRYPDREIYLFDSLAASLGEGLQAIRAAKCCRAGKSPEETIKILEHVRNCMRQIFVVDDLAFLHRTGRISSLSRIVGSVLGVRPILMGDPDGKIIMSEKTRGKKSAIDIIANKYKALAKSARSVGISYAGCLKDAEYLMRLIKSGPSALEIIMVKHEPATGAHLGPGALALYFESVDSSIGIRRTRINL